MFMIFCPNTRLERLQAALSIGQK